MSPPTKAVDGVGADYPDPVREDREMMETVGQELWEDLATAPRIGTEPSGLFNNLDMDLASGISTVESVVGSTELISDPVATSTVDITELFPDLTGLLGGSVPEESSPPQVTDGGEVEIDLVCCPTSTEVTSAVSVVKREQLPSTSSCASVSEMSDYEEGLSPAEVDTALEHFFNSFIDLKGFLDVPAEATSPAATADAATVRSLNDDTTTENGAHLSHVLTVDDGSLALSAVNATKRVKSEDSEDEEEEETCHIAKKSRGAATKLDPETAYRQRRMKNNMACKRARQNRKKRESDLSITADALEAENAQLRAKIEELTEIAEMSRRALVNVLAQ